MAVSGGSGLSWGGWDLGYIRRVRAKQVAAQQRHIAMLSRVRAKAIKSATAMQARQLAQPQINNQARLIAVRLARSAKPLIRHTV